MALQLVCDCGKQLNVPDAHAGRTVQCPTCGRAHQIPVSAAAPGAVPAAGRDGKGKTWVLVVLVLLILAGAALWWWYFYHNAPSVPGTEGDDLALIPSNAPGFLSTRLADLWNAPATHKALKKARENDPGREDPAIQMERETGLTPEDVERLTAVDIDLDRRLGWVIVRTLKPYDSRKILTKLHDRREVAYKKGQVYHVGTTAENQTAAIHFVGTRVLVAGSEEGVQRCLDFLAEAPATGPLSPAITLAGGKHTAVGCFRVEGALARRLEANVFTKNLTTTKKVTSTLEVDTGAILETTIKTASEEDAKKLQKEATKYQNPKGFGAGLLRTTAVTVALGENAALAGPLLKVYDKSKFEQKGDSVIATTRFDDGSSVAEMLLLLAKKLK
jgi:hypothetical protein